MLECDLQYWDFQYLQIWDVCPGSGSLPRDGFSRGVISGAYFFPQTIGILRKANGELLLLPTGVFDKHDYITSTFCSRRHRGICGNILSVPTAVRGSLEHEAGWWRAVQ